MNFHDVASLRKQYMIMYTSQTEGVNHSDNIITKETHAVLHGLKPGTAYMVKVVAMVGNVASEPASCNMSVETSMHFASLLEHCIIIKFFFSVPEVVRNLRSKESNGSVIFEWDQFDIPPREYGIQLRINNDAVVEDHVFENSFTLDFAKPATAYSLRVSAINSSGHGKMSQWNTCITSK